MLGGLYMANSVRDYEKLAVDIINAVGGKKNMHQRLAF